MPPRGTRGAYRKEERAEMPKDLQRELVEKASARFGTQERLAKKLELPKSSVHYYRTGRLTLPVSVMERLLKLAGNPELEERVREASVVKDRTWANAYAAGIHREMCRERVRLPTPEELENDDVLRRKTAAIVSYVMAEGSIWIKHNRFDAPVVNITFADHETDLYDHFRSLCRDVFAYDIGPPQEPGNRARAIRGFVFSRFIAEWLMENGASAGEKSATALALPTWITDSDDDATFAAAIQPFFDGEGHIAVTKRGCAAGVIVTQARHTDIDFNILQHRLGWRGKSRTRTAGQVRDTMMYGMDAVDFCSMVHRSEILDELRVLLTRLGFHPQVKLGNMYLKDDGFWSVNWNLRISARESRRLIDSGIVTQKRKARRLGLYMQSLL